MERLQTFRTLFLAPRILIGGAITILGFYDLFVAQVLQRTVQERMPILADFILLIGWPWWTWVITILVLLIVFLFEGAHKQIVTLEGRLTMITKEEAPEIVELAKLRTEGVGLRNYGKRLQDPSKLVSWIESYEDWENRMLEVLRKLSPGKAEWLHTLDKMPFNHWPDAISHDHIRYVGVFDEQLRRLDFVLRQYLHLPTDV